MGWSDLPADLVGAIAGRLATELADLARFRSVCPSWRLASTAHAARRCLPLLLLPTQYQHRPQQPCLVPRRRQPRGGPTPRRSRPLLPLRLQPRLDAGRLRP